MKDFITKLSISYVIGALYLLQIMPMTAHSKNIWVKDLYSQSRLAVDKRLDFARKPYKTLKFYNIQPGSKVLELFAGDGYYAELFSYAVGDKGTVIAHYRSCSWHGSVSQLKAKKAKNRYKRLNNVETFVEDPNHFNLKENEFDAIFIMDSYHDIFYTADTRWPVIDEENLIQQVFKALKPNGMLGVIDHRAIHGSPTSTGNTLHRIDPSYVKKRLIDAGFIFSGSANFLSNPRDNLKKHMMFVPYKKGGSSRFVFKFTKPKEIKKETKETFVSQF